MKEGSDVDLSGGLAALRDMFASSRSDEEPERVVRPFLRACLALFPADGALLVLAGEPGARYFLTRPQFERSSPRVGHALVLEPAGLTGCVVRDAKPRIVSLPDPQGDFDPVHDGIPGVENPGQILAVPLDATSPSPGCLALLFARAIPDGPLRMGDLSRLAMAGFLALEQQSSFGKLRQLSTTDDLTGVYNYRYLLDNVRREIRRARRFQQVFSFVMLDIDHLKDYNDLHGHLAGSRLLASFAQIVRAQLRAVDAMAKYGGDEFGVVLPQTDKRGAWVVAERIRSSVEAHRFPGETRKITASLGIATFPEDGKDLETLLGRADEALYRAKNLGRNRVCAAGEERGPEGAPGQANPVDTPAGTV